MLVAENGSLPYDGSYGGEGLGGLVCRVFTKKSIVRWGKEPSGAVAPDERLLQLKDNHNNAKWRNHLSTMIVNDV